MARLAFVGLGQMGRHMAANLVQAGTQVVVHARRREVADALAAKGANLAATPDELANADIVFCCLPDAAALRDVLFGVNGLAFRLAPGACVVDTGTSDYKATLEIAEALAARGIRFVDAPVSGMEARARDGTLTIMCGADAALFAEVEPFLLRMGRIVLRVGAVGAGQLMKLVNQLLFDINAAAIAEILPMAVKLGLDPAQVAEVVNSGTGRSHASEFFAPRVLERRFSDGYPLKAAYKDLVSGADISARLAIPMPVLAAATATYQQALLMGHGDKDKGAMILVFEDLLGVRFEAQNQRSNRRDRDSRPGQWPHQLWRPRLCAVPETLLRPLNGCVVGPLEAPHRRHRFNALGLQQLPSLHAGPGGGRVTRSFGSRRPAPDVPDHFTR